MKEMELQIIEQDIKSLSDEDLAKALDLAFALKAQINDVIKEGEKRLNEGITLNRYKLISTIPRKKWIDEEKVINFLKDKYGDRIFDINLKSPNQIHKFVGREYTMTLLSKHIVEISSNTKIAKEF